MRVPEITRRPAKRFASRLYHWAWTGLDWLYPPTCGGCGQRGTRWCAGCRSDVQLIPLPVCEICGQPMPKTGVCHACRADRPRFSAQRSWAVFAGPVRQALHRLKYQGDVALGEALAYGLVELLDDLFWRVEVVVPVPLGAERRRERGYNQAALLARPVALACGLSYAPSLLEKTHPNRPQVGLNAAQRRQNVRGVYTAQKNQAAGKQVLVIDDVTTTGATLDDCARALLEAGAQCVYGLTLARAVLHV